MVLLLAGLGLAVIIAIFTLFLLNERARTRDAERITDVTRLAAGFALLYNQKASFLDAAVGCPTVGSLASACTLQNIIPGIGDIKDPGSFSYIVSKVPDRDDFAIQFRLEKKYGTLLPGFHLLTRAGIQ